MNTDAVKTRPLKVAVLDPVGFRGGQARALQLVAEGIHLGSRVAGTPADVVIGYLETPRHQAEDYSDLLTEIKLRPFHWRMMDANEARRSLTYAGLPLPAALEREYQVPDDGINQFFDCDLWLFISDRLLKPLLPIRPYALMVYDYIQRYQPGTIPETANLAFLRAARNANGVLVTTLFTYQDALQYAGIVPDRVHKVPMLAPLFAIEGAVRGASEGRDYFVWTTNSGIHKNHVNAVKALRIYYEEMGGALRCLLTGFNSDAIPKGSFPHLEPVRDMFSKSAALQEKVVAMGDLSDARYRSLLAGARFLWHPARIDNGTFSVVEAACLGVPSLSSDYPAMREMDVFYDLGLNWCEPNEPAQMASQLKRLEQESEELGKKLPSANDLNARGVGAVAVDYWKAVQACL